MSSASFSNPALLQALAEIASADDPARRRRVYEELLRARLLVLTPRGQGVITSEGGSPKEMAIELFTLRAEDGRTGLPVFTDQEALRRFGPPEALISLLLDGRIVFRLALESDIDAVVINPGGPAGGEVERPEMSALAQGQIPDSGTVGMSVIDAGTEVSIQPLGERPPARFVDRLQEVVPGHPEIRACYLYRMGLGAEDLRLTLGLALDGPQEPDELRRLLDSLVSELGNTMDGAGDIQCAVIAADDLPAVEARGFKVFGR